MTYRPIDLAIKIIGTGDKTARLLKVTPQAVSRWVQSGQVPAKRCLELSRLTGGVVTVHQLRPDIYGEPPKRPRRKRRQKNKVVEATT